MINYKSCSAYLCRAVLYNFIFVLHKDALCYYILWAPLNKGQSLVRSASTGYSQPTRGCNFSSILQLGLFPFQHLFLRRLVSQCSNCKCILQQQFVNANTALYMRQVKHTCHQPNLKLIIGLNSPFLTILKNF